MSMPCHLCGESPCGHYNECPPKTNRPQAEKASDFNYNRILGVLRDVREALHLYHRDDVRFRGLIGDVKAAVAELDEKDQ